MDPNRLEEMFLKMLELYATVKADIKHLTTKTDLYEHSVKCPAVKRHRLLMLVGSLLTGAGFLAGIFFTKL